MQIGATPRTGPTVRLRKGGNKNTARPSTAAKAVSAYEHPFIDELTQIIDPYNMSRDEAREMAAALGRAGDLAVDNAIALHSMVLVNENGGEPMDAEPEAAMSEKINMVEALNKQIEFNRQHGHSTSHLEDGLKLLEKFRALRENPKIDLYT